MNDTIRLEEQYCAHNYHPLPVVLKRGEGVFVWDEAGKKYLDMMSAYSAVSKETHETVVRLAPPLTLGRRELDWAVTRIREVLEEAETVRRAS